MATAPQFDPALFRRYDCNGPRYTSYPTAPQFRDDFDATAYRAAALLSNQRATALSVYIHVPFCAAPCFYCGCNRVITRNPRQGERYVQALSREIEMQSRLFDVHRRVEQVHFGGGTPTFLSPAQIETVLRRLRQEFPFATKHCESSIEIDPRTVSADAVARLATLGFNRISIGVQDFDSSVQEAVNRVQSIEQTSSVVDAARGNGIEAISFDLIYGLPRQTLPGFRQTLEAVKAMRPSRIAVYGYAHLPALFKAQRHIVEADLPSPQLRLELLAMTVQELTAAGYAHIGLDHFVLPDDPLAVAQSQGQLQRNFQGYSSHADCDLIGLGVSAIGKVGSVYAQNAKTLARYYERVEDHRLAIERGLQLSSDDRIRRAVIQSLMCHGVIDVHAIERDHCIEFADYFAPELGQLRALLHDELLERVDSRIVVSGKGRFLVRNIAMVFDAYLRQRQAHAYSKAI